VVNINRIGHGVLWQINKNFDMLKIIIIFAEKLII
jgi:hypothetical protein